MGLTKRVLDRIITKPGYRCIAGALVAAGLLWGYNSFSGKSDAESRTTHSSALEIAVTSNNPAQFTPVQNPSFSALPIVKFLNENNIPYDVIDDRLILSEGTIQQMSDVIGLSAKKTRDYLCTEKHRTVLYALQEHDPNLRKAIMTVESHGNGTCNNRGYCGEMQIGTAAVTEVLRSLLHIGLKTRYDNFRDVNQQQLDYLADLVDEQTGGFLTDFSSLNNGVIEAKRFVNQRYQQCDDQIKSDGYDEETSQLREDLGRFNRYLSAVNNYLNTLVVSLEKEPKTKREQKEVRVAREQIAQSLAALEKFRGRDFSFVTKDLESKFGIDYSSVTPQELFPKLEREYYSKNVTDVFSSLWDAAKGDSNLNVTLSRVYLAYLDHRFEQLSVDSKGKQHPQYQNIDPLAWILEAYNKGANEVHSKVMRTRRLPPGSGYSDKVIEALQLIRTYNELFYGDSNMVCTDVGLGVECEVPEAMQTFVDSRN